MFLYRRKLVEHHEARAVRAKQQFEEATTALRNSQKRKETFTGYIKTLEQERKFLHEAGAVALREVEGAAKRMATIQFW